jgi:hypothetical protein
MKNSLLAFCLLAFFTLACGQVVTKIPATPAVPTDQPITVTPIIQFTVAVPTPAITLATVTASRSVNVRSDATKHSEDIGDLYYGDVVYVLYCRNGWVRIRQGWVNSYYLSLKCK